MRMRRGPWAQNLLLLLLLLPLATPGPLLLG
jgi:hypothetical protein